jgi:hypothetical protein
MRIIRTLLAFACAGFLLGTIACNKSSPLDPSQTCNDSKATNFGGPLPCQYPPPFRSVVFNLRGSGVGPMGEPGSTIGVCARPPTGSGDGIMDMTLVYDTTPDASVQLYIFDTPVEEGPCFRGGVSTLLPQVCSDYLAAALEGLPTKVQAAGPAAQLQKNLCFLIRNRSAGRLTLMNGSTIGYTPTR